MFAIRAYLVASLFTAFQKATFSASLLTGPISILLLEPVCSPETKLLNSKIRQELDLNMTYDISCEYESNTNDLIDLFSEGSYNIYISFVDYDLDCLLLKYSEIYRRTFMTPFGKSRYALGEAASVFSQGASFEDISIALRIVLKHFRWGHIAILAELNEYNMAMSAAAFIELTHSGFEPQMQYIRNSSTFEELIIALQNVEGTQKAVIFLTSPALCGRLLTAAAFIAWAQQHAIFIVETNPYLRMDTHHIPAVTGFLNETHPLLDSIFFLVPIFSSNRLSKGQIGDEKSVNRSRRSDSPNLQSVYNFIYDSIIVIDTILSNATRLDSQDFFSSLARTSLNVYSGVIKMDGDGRIAFDFGLFDLDSLTLEARKVQEIIQLPDNDWEIKGLAEIKWPNDVELGPDECFMVPSCNETSRGLDALYIVAIVVSVLFVAGMATAIVIVVWRKLVHRDMSKGQHKVLLSSEDLVFLRKRDVQKGSKMLSSSLIERPDLIKASTGEKQSANRSLASLHEYADITDTARYNGDLVHVKELKVKNFELKTKVLNVIKSLREIRHENVNAVVGFYEEPESPAFITDFCTRGSLEDVLKNHDIKLDWDFKVSLLTDLIRGVRYIHNSSVRWHGNLKCRNCLIDSRWVLKVSDFGLSGFYGAAKLSPKYQNTDLLWTAPEHLRQPVPPLHGSERGDVFSIAIIMQCVVLRSDPYSTSGLSPAEIIQKLRHPPPLLRPSVSHGTAPPQYIQLMKMCWTENPEMRPSIEEVYQQYKLFTGGKKMNIVDTMFRMLEKYSTDLEELVKDRTLQLEEEKKKTDLLLYRMLPPVVADSLKVGRTIAAEQFSEVTIYFSDIVGFTTISANSTPMQVVDLLNDLYTMFDATIDAYDVYKVETIGDAYMVCSGLPVRNENRHAGEISTMALDLLAQCGHFTIKHMPEVPLRVRIGLHSGPCVAGVVGLTMPRYCLFGDTVNTASRMESTGSAYRIHISEAVRVTLDELGGYHFRYRGEVELKGKGMAKTYWLVGKDGFDKELPTPPPVTNGDNHGISLEDFKLKALKRTDTTGLFKICHTDSKSSIESEKNDNNGEHKPNDSKLIVVKPVDCDACVDHNNEAKHADCKSDPSHDPPEGQSRNNQGSNDSGIASRGDASYIIEEARPDAMIPQTSKPSRHSALVGAGASKGAHCLTDNSTIKAVANPSRSVLPQSPLYMNGKEHSVNPMSNISTKNFKHQSVVTELVEVTSESVRDQTRDSYPLHESLPEGHTLEGSEVNANETDTNTKEVYLKNKGLRPTLDATSENTKSPNNLSSTPGAFNACNCNLKNLELVPRGQSVLVNGKTMVYSNGSNKEKHCLICNSNYTTEEHNLDIFRESLV